MDRPELIPILTATEPSETAPAAALSDEALAFAGLVYGSSPDTLSTAAAYLDPETTHEPLSPEVKAIVTAVQRIVEGHIDTGFTFDPATDGALRRDPAHRRLKDKRERIGREARATSAHKLSAGAIRGPSQQLLERHQGLGDTVRYDRLRVFIGQVAAWQRETLAQS